MRKLVFKAICLNVYVATCIRPKRQVSRLSGLLPNLGAWTGPRIIRLYLITLCHYLVWNRTWNQKSSNYIKVSLFFNLCIDIFIHHFISKYMHFIFHMPYIHVSNMLWEIFIMTFHAMLNKTDLRDSRDRPSNLTRIASKLLIFQPVWPWHLMDDVEKQ